MRTPYSILFALALVGCTAGGSHNATLTADQAENLARKLANERSQALFRSQPFREGTPAQFVEGHWLWHDQRGQGNGDVEATVEFAADGTEPSVDVTFLDGRPEPLR